MKTVRLAVVVALVGCKGHAHDAVAHDADELPGQSITVWTAHHELFMEYRPFVVGQDTTFAAHVTLLPSYKPLATGEVTVAVRLAGGGELTGTADIAKPAGIFRPAVVPDRPGACTLAITIEHDAVRDVIEGGPCQVFADAAAAAKALGGDEAAPGRITYLKEQAWKTEFAIHEVAIRPLQPGIRAAGELKPAAGREARLTAPTAGRIAVADPPPVLGAAIAKGQVLGSVAPRLAVTGDRPSLDADVQTARAQLDAARQATARAERLHADQAIPERQLEEARTAERIASARLAAATGRLSQYAAGASGGGGGGTAYQIRSPIAGTLVQLAVASGQQVAEGDLVMTVVDLTTVWLEVQVFEPDIPKVEASREAWFTLDGHAAPFHVDETNGARVTLGRMIDPATRTVPLIFEVANPDGALRVGQFARVTVASGPPIQALAIPESAIVEDAGTPVAYVELEGESFERRPLTLGARAGGWVEVVDGVAAGEHVVSVGAYELKLASSGGAVPAHGHVH